MIDNAYKTIQERRLKPWKGEEEVRFIWMKAIENATGLSLNAERNRKDSSHNHVIIEFKAPGLFYGRKDSPSFINATQKRLFPYIQKESNRTGIPASDFIGIAIDGDHVCFAQVSNNQIYTEHLIPFSKYAVYLVIDAFISDKRKSLTIENLMSDFGYGSENAREFMQSMSDGLSYYLEKEENNKIKMLFEEWRTLYGQVADMSSSQSDSIKKELIFKWNGKSDLSISGRLFVVHTYNSMLIKLLAAEIVSSHGLTSTTHPAQNMSSQEDDSKLIHSLDYLIEKSAIFEEACINGFVEEAIFSWYLDIAREKIIPSFLPSLRKLLSSLSLYRLDRLSRTRDVLRDLYQSLVPGKLRQSLGEFYTPDWLVDFTLGKINDNALLDKRVLDPTCGSGAFLLAIIRKKREYALAQKWSVPKTIKHLCKSIWGFDLNPLAVQTARVNFLMEIADLLAASPGIEIEVPILMADAIYSPADTPSNINSVVEYNIGSHIAKLNIHLPTELALNRERLDSVFEIMGSCVEQDLEFNKTKEDLILANVITKKEFINWAQPLKHTYGQVLDLHRKQWNGIWFRIVRNFFWSATAGKFDIVIGNPPWVRWSKLPDLYRERVKPTCEKYGIFSKTKRHGGNELDISAMITYTVSDKWLENGGCLAFVITGTLFKNPSSAGFRAFRLERINQEPFHLQPLSIDDMKDLKPFEDANNHTTVAVFQKTSEEVIYPVNYSIWSAKPGFKKAIKASTSLSDIFKKITFLKKEAFPVGDIGSPWTVLNHGRFNAIKYLSSQCKWTQGRKGITTDLNGVYFVPILKNGNNLVQIESRPEAGKKDIGVKKTQWIEPTLLYPLIKGAGDFEECYLNLNSPDYDETKQRLFTIIPNKGISNVAYKQSEIDFLSPTLKKTLAWFKGYEGLLCDRSTYRRQMKGAPYYAIYNVGEYTFKPWKVIWPEMSSSFYAAVASSHEVPIVGNRVYIPDHKIYFASFDDKKTAYYLCGLLNSPTVQEWINSHNISIQVADIFKHLTLPCFDTSNSNHVKLSTCVEKAHQCHDKTKRQNLVREIKSLAENILSSWRGDC